MRVSDLVFLKSHFCLTKKFVNRLQSGRPEKIKMSEKDYFEANRQGWNLKTEVHRSSDFYEIEKWKAGASSLQKIELEELGSVTGKKLLHLQCHFGQDTLSWARLGAQVTGVDFSENAIALAHQFSAELDLPARFVCSDIYELPKNLKGKFDIVFTSWGVIGWLPDLDRWARVVRHFLRRGGRFYMVEFHPVVWMFDDKFTHLKYPYHNAGVIETEEIGSYADRYSQISYKEYGWNHSLSEVVNSLINSGLRLQFLNEHTYSPYDCFSNTVCGDDGFYRIKGLENIIPMAYSLSARG